MIASEIRECLMLPEIRDIQSELASAVHLPLDYIFKANARQDADLADPSKPGGPSDFTDANPVDAEHVYLLMANNFPSEAIAWVKRARWTGPSSVPWNRVDTDDEDKWAADHEHSKVNEFVRQIRDHDGHVAPSILVQEPSSGKAFLVDGHHRALARRKLGQPVLAYLGNIDPKDRMAALETHTHQIHQGSDPQNKEASPPKG